MREKISNWFSRQYWGVWFWLGNAPWATTLFRKTFVRKWQKGKPVESAFCRDVTKETVMVWEGFPSSGNSSSTKLIRKAVGREVPITNHTHSANLIAHAIRLEKPVVVLIRDPLDCVESMTRRWSFHKADTCLSWYILFYKRLMPIREELIVVKFSTVISDIGRVFSHLRERHGLEIDCTVDIKSEWVVGKKLALLSEDERQRLVTEKNERRAHIEKNYPELLAEAQAVCVEFSGNSI